MSDIDEGLQAIHKVLKDIRKTNRDIFDLLSEAKETVLEAAAEEGEEVEEKEPKSTGSRRTG